MATDPNALLKSEIESWSVLHRMQKGSKVPQDVVKSSGRTLAFLEELLEWREKGQKLLNKWEEEDKLKNRTIPLRQNIFVPTVFGPGETNGKVLTSEGSDNQVLWGARVPTEGQR